MLPMACMNNDLSYEVDAPYNHSHAARAINDLIEMMDGGNETWNGCLRGCIDCIYDSTMSGNQKYFIDKTPRNVLVLPFIERVFPDAKYIFLFRQPLAIMSSIVKTWNDDKFMPDYQNKIDLHDGPELLVEGWERNKHKSIRISYEELVMDVDKTLDAVYNYLGLEADLKDYTVPDHLKGTMGDKTGVSKYKQVSAESLNTWVQVFNSWYRKKYALNYLDFLGEDLIARMGYNKKSIINELSRNGCSFKLGIADYLNIVRVRIYHAVTGKIAKKIWHKVLVPGNLFK